MVLFIFYTHEACKYLQRIETEPKLTFSNHIMDVTKLEEALNNLIAFPDGNLHLICRIDNVFVLMWNFSDYTRCSEATDKDFAFTIISEAIFKIPKP